MLIAEFGRLITSGSKNLLPAFGPPFIGLPERNDPVAKKADFSRFTCKNWYPEPAKIGLLTDSSSMKLQGRKK